MFDHVTLRTADLERTARLLTPPMTALGLPPFRGPSGSFSLVEGTRCDGAFVLDPDGHDIGVVYHNR